MKVFADDKSLSIACPKCKAPVGVCCGYYRQLGGTVCETRDRLTHEDI